MLLRSRRQKPASAAHLIPLLLLNYKNREILDLIKLRSGLLSWYGRVSIPLIIPLLLLLNESLFALLSEFFQVNQLASMYQLQHLKHIGLEGYITLIELKPTK